MPDLIELLIARKLISKAQAESAERRAKLTGVPIEQAILELKLCPEMKFYELLSELAKLPLVDLAALPPMPVDNAKVSLPVAMKFQCLPVSSSNGMITLAAAFPLQQTQYDQLKLLLGMNFKLVLARRSQLEARLKMTYGIAAESLLKIQQQRGIDRTADAQPALPDTAETSEGDNASIIGIVNEILAAAIQSGATDIHFEPYRGSLRIRFRIDGMLHDIPTPSGLDRLAESMVSRIKVMAQLNITEKRLPHDGRLRIVNKGQPCDFRVSILPTRFGEALCLRLLNARNLLLNLNELGLSDQQMHQLTQVISRTNGLLLVTGPTGSGKTTTLYSILTHLRDLRPEMKIITVENPVEYELEGVTQIQTHAEIGLTFSSALRSILRHDPDIILIGEIRDQETAEIAIQSALTGHLVFSTLHTNDAVGAVNRLINMGVEADLVAASLNCVIAQRLLRRLCPHCRQAAAVPDQLRREYENATAAAGLALPETVYVPSEKGCEFCEHTGYSGRIAVYEFLPISEALEDRIAARTPNSELRAAARNAGLPSLRDDAWLKVAAGITSVDELLRVTAGR